MDERGRVDWGVYKVYMGYIMDEGKKEVYRMGDVVGYRAGRSM